jgi:hypothetical protein
MQDMEVADSMKDCKEAVDLQMQLYRALYRHRATTGDLNAAPVVVQAPCGSIIFDTIVALVLLASVTALLYQWGEWEAYFVCTLLQVACLQGAGVGNGSACVLAVVCQIGWWWSNFPLYTFRLLAVLL